MDFDIHGLKIRADQSYLFPDYFRVESVDKPDLTIERESCRSFAKVRHERLGLQFWGGGDTVYFESSGYYRHLQQILLSGLLDKKTVLSFHSDTKRHGVENLIKLVFQVKLLQKGMTLVHAAGLEKDGEGVLISGWPRSGKSSTALKLARESGYKLLGDDMVILGEDGTIYSFPKKAGVFWKSRHKLNLSRAEKLALWRKYVGVRFFPPFHSLFDRSLRVDLERLAPVKDTAPLGRVYLGRKTEGSGVERLEASDAADKVLAHVLNIFYHHPFPKRFLLAYSLLNNTNPFYFEEETKRVIQKALQNKRAYLTRDPSGNFGRHFEK